MCHSSSISSLAPSEQSKGAEQPRAGLKLVDNTVLCPTPQFPEKSSASEEVVVACVVVVVVVVAVKVVVAETEILFNKVKI
jgi:hypothetical protein